MAHPISYIHDLVGFVYMPHEALCQLILLMKADLHPNCAAPSAKRLTALNILMVAKDPFSGGGGGQYTSNSSPDLISCVRPRPNLLSHPQT